MTCTRRYAALGACDSSPVDPAAQARLVQLGAPDEDVANILRALFTGSGTVGIDNFVRRAQRLQSPFRLDLMESCSPAL